MAGNYISFLRGVTTNIAVIIFIVLLWYGSAGAFAFLEGNLSLHGKMITQVGVHLQDDNAGGSDFDSGDLSMMTTWVDIETSYRIHEYLSVAAIGRAYKNWVYNIENSYQSRFQDTGRGFLDPQLRYDRSWNKNSEEWTEDVDLREIYLDVGLGNSGNLRLGKQQITWGEADGVRLADIINPLNIGYHFNLESWEDIRIPIVAAYLNFIPPSFEDWTIDIVYTEDFERAVRGEPGSGSTWAFPLPLNARTQPIPGVDLIPIFLFDEPDRESRNSEYGARISYKSNFSGMEFSAFYFHTFNDLPILEFRGETQTGPQPGVTLPKIWLVFDEYDNYGFTFNAFSETFKTVFRGEFVFIDDIAFNAASPGFDPFVPANAALFHQEERNQYKGMIGFDRNTFIRPLNATKSFYMSGQYFYLYTDDTDGLIDSTYTDQGVEDETHILTFMVNTAYMQEQLAPFVLVLWSPDDKWWQVQTNLAYTSTDFHWKYILGANFMGGESNFAEMGLFENHNEVYFKVQYSF